MCGHFWVFRRNALKAGKLCLPQFLHNYGLDRLRKGSAAANHARVSALMQIFLFSARRSDTFSSAYFRRN